MASVMIHRQLSPSAAKSINGRKALKGMALKGRRSSENKRKVSKRHFPLGNGKDLLE
jgi:hypothetical protein